MMISLKRFAIIATSIYAVAFISWNVALINLRHQEI